MKISIKKYTYREQLQLFETQSIYVVVLKKGNKFPSKVNNGQVRTLYVRINFNIIIMPFKFYLYYIS